MSRAFGRVPKDNKYSSLEYSEKLTNCDGNLSAKRVDACAVDTLDLEATNAVFRDLTVTNVEAEEVEVENPPIAPNLFRVVDTMAVDSISSLGNAGVTQVDWELTQVYVQVGNTWSTLLTAPIPSGPNTPPYVGYPAPQNNLLVAYLQFLENAFISSGIQQSHGFRVLNPRFAGARASFEFELAVNATIPENPAVNAPVVGNFVIAVRRTDDGGSDNMYLYVMNDVLNGNANEQLVYFSTTPAVNPGLPPDPGFFAGFGLVIPIPFVDNYYYRFEQRYVLDPTSAI